MTQYLTVFDSVILAQLKKLGKDRPTREIISKMLDRIENRGSNAGKLLDSQLHLFEMKTNRPPIRLYYKINEATKEAYVFEFEIKTGSEKQQRTINRIRGKLKS